MFIYYLNMLVRKLGNLSGMSKIRTDFWLVVCVRTEKDKYSLVGEGYKYRLVSAAVSLDHSIISRSVEHSSENYIRRR